jgi:precorrin-2/cobalt-factor-2 C20-methyltransferase
MVAIQTGRLYGIGVGPGDPELLTLKALRLLQAAPVVAYQSANDHESIARSIVAPYLRGNQIEVPFHFPRALDPEAAQELYADAIKPISAHLAAGRDVVVLCCGDPLFYGSFMYLFTRLADRFVTEIVPGVSSPMGAAAAIGMPLCYRNDIFSVLSATLPVEVLTTQLANADAVAIIKLRRHFDKVYQILTDLDLLARAKYIEHATGTEQKIVSIEDVDPRNVPYFAMIIIPSKTQF